MTFRYDWSTSVNLRRLQAFRAVFETGSVTEAAGRLHLSQPAVSRLISDLEHELGLSLFARQRRRLLPTPEGRAFYSEAERALAAVDQIVDIARDIRTLKGAHLRIVGVPPTVYGLIPSVLEVVAAAHPHARFSVDTKDLREIVQWVNAGPFDIALTVRPPEGSVVDYEPLATMRGVLIMPRKHRLAGKRRVLMKELAGEAMVAPVAGNVLRERIGAVFQAAGLPYVGRIETNTALSACQFVAHGLGLAVMDPLTFWVVRDMGIVARPLHPTVEFQFGFLFPRNRPRSTLVNAFVHATRKIVDRARHY
jgi:DNA-binding transcriptional LysR family regulator